MPLEKSAREDLQEAQNAITELFGRVEEIQDKASQSESLVVEFCRSIKFLDLAKTNLTHTVTGFKRFVMLVTALEQLRTFALARKYQDVSNLLSACEQLSKHFEKLAKVLNNYYYVVKYIILNTTSLNTH